MVENAYKSTYVYACVLWQEKVFIVITKRWSVNTGGILGNVGNSAFFRGRKPFLVVPRKNSQVTLVSRHVVAAKFFLVG